MIALQKLSQAQKHIDCFKTVATTPTVLNTFSDSIKAMFSSIKRTIKSEQYNERSLKRCC